MAGRYIPPALRAREAQELRNTNDSDRASGPARSGLRGGISRPLMTRSDALPDGDLYSTKEIEHHFWPDSEHQTSGAQQRTLHDSAATLGVLSYVLLFKDANPRWQDDGIIFTKSSLELLPAELADNANENEATDGTTAEDTNAFSAPNGSDHMGNGESEAVGQEHEEVNQEAGKPRRLRRHQQPIAVFSQIRRSSIKPSRNFKFTGYYRIACLSFLQPHSPDLIRMLEQKWSLTNPRTGHVRQRQRDASAWQESLKVRWAVVKFERDEEAMKSLGSLMIERLEDENDEEFDGRQGGGGGTDRRMSGRGRKGVNELLRELRMGDEVKNEKKEEKETLDAGVKEEQTH